MSAILDLHIKGVRIGNLAIPEGATIGSLRQTLIVAGYNIENSYARVWRGVDQNDIYVGNCDNMKLEAYDSIAFCGPDYCVSVAFNGAHSSVPVETHEAEGVVKQSTCIVSYNDPLCNLRPATCLAVENAIEAGEVIRTEFDKICDSFVKIKAEIKKII